MYYNPQQLPNPYQKITQRYSSKLLSLGINFTSTNQCVAFYII